MNLTKGGVLFFFEAVQLFLTSLFLFGGWEKTLYTNFVDTLMIYPFRFETIMHAVCDEQVDVRNLYASHSILADIPRDLSSLT